MMFHYSDSCHCVFFLVRCILEYFVQCSFLIVFKAQEEENLKQLEILLKQKEAEMERTFTNRLHQSLVDVEMDHKTELANFASEIEAAEHHNNNLNVEIEVLKGRLEEMRTNMLKVLEAFRDFIETSPGFADGQGEFVLDQLVPPKLNEFLLMK